MKKHKYLSNKELLPEVMEFKRTGIASEKLGHMLLLLSRQISYKRWFIRYDESTKQDMIGFAVLTCLKYLKNFDPHKEKYPNPFAYLTQIIINAFKAHLKQYYGHLNIKQECYNKMDLVDESDPYKSIDYNQLKKWDEFRDESSINKFNMICSECELVQTMEIEKYNDINEQNQEIIEKGCCLECGGILNKLNKGIIKWENI